MILCDAAEMIICCNMTQAVIFDVIAYYEKLSYCWIDDDDYSLNDFVQDIYAIFCGITCSYNAIIDDSDIIHINNVNEFRHVLGTMFFQEHFRTINISILSLANTGLSVFIPIFLYGVNGIQLFKFNHYNNAITISDVDNWNEVIRKMPIHNHSGELKQAYDPIMIWCMIYKDFLDSVLPSSHGDSFTGYNYFCSSLLLATVMIFYFH